MEVRAMTFWLYSEAVMKRADIDAVLNDWGKCQWELVAFLPAAGNGPNGEGPDLFRAIFKRPDDTVEEPDAG
jgi:hypothetical protein